MEGYSPDQAVRMILDKRTGAVPAWEAYHGCCEDLVARHREAIELRAYELYQHGVNGDAHADWCQATAEVLRVVLIKRSIGISDSSS